MSVSNHSDRQQLQEQVDLMSDDYLRIVRADLVRRIQRSVSINPSLKKYVVTEADHFYISLKTFKDPAQRRHIRRQLQRIQLDERADLSRLPTPLQRLLKPEWTPIGRFVTAAIISSVVGISAGTLAMAASLLLTAVTELIIGGDMNTNLIGMQITAVAFVIFSVLGAAVTMTRIWRHVPGSLSKLLRRLGAGASSQSPQSSPTPPRPESSETAVHTE